MIDKKVCMMLCEPRMNLKKITEQNIGQLKDKKICCVEKSLSYLEELCAKYGVLGQIISIADTNRRNHGEFIFQGKTLQTYDLSCLSAIDFRDTVIIITSDYYKEVFEITKSFLEREVLGKTENMVLPEIYYFANQETEYEEYYREMYADTPLEDMIVFRSGPHASSYVKGMDFGDNARALFEYALQKGLNDLYELVWLVKDPVEYERYGAVKNVSFLSFDWSVSEKQSERDAYYRVLCLAKYLFFTDAYGFARNCRKDQIRVQLWHGCGFKTRVNFVRCEKRYEYTTVISDLYADIHADIYGLRKDQILVTGYAKQDWLFHPKEEDIEKLRIPKGNKYIFWLPTFRSTERKLEQLNEYEIGTETGLSIVDTKEKMAALNLLLSENGIVLVVKLHPFQDRRAVHCEDCTNIHLVENEDLAEQDIPINRLLGQADALISDYSSAAVDYMLLDRPIAFMLEDVEEYAESRGFVFDNIREWLPGREIFTFQDICEFVKEIAAGQDLTAEKRRMLKRKMHCFDDDHNSQRIMDALQIG